MLEVWKTANRKKNTNRNRVPQIEVWKLKFGNWSLNTSRNHERRNVKVKFGQIYRSKSVWERIALRVVMYYWSNDFCWRCMGVYLDSGRFLGTQDCAFTLRFYLVLYSTLNSCFKDTKAVGAWRNTFGEFICSKSSGRFIWATATASWVELGP